MRDEEDEEDKAAAGRSVLNLLKKAAENLGIILIAVAVCALLFFKPVLKETVPEAVSKAQSAVKESADEAVSEFFGKGGQATARETAGTRYPIRQEFALVYNCIFEGAKPEQLPEAEYEKLAGECAAELERIEAQFPTFEAFANANEGARLNPKRGEE